MSLRIWKSLLRLGVLIGASYSMYTHGGEQMRVYFGTFTRGDEGGIFQSTLNLETGELAEPSLAGQSVQSGFLDIHPNGKHLYAVGELAGFTERNADSVCAFEINAEDGTLKAMNKQPGGGGEPCHLTIDPTGRFVLSAQYGGGSCSVYPIAGDGSLKPKSSFHQHVGFSGVNAKRQEAPHAHSINLDPSGMLAVVADLGKDQVLVYQFNTEAGVLTPNDPAAFNTPAGSGPRHFVFHPSKPFAYVNMELTSEVSALSYDLKSGAFKTLETLSTLPEDFDGLKAVAEIRITPDGRFIYVSNRGHDSLAIFKVDQKTGRLTLNGHESTRGTFPRNFNIDPTGRFLIAANQNSNNVVVFKIDQNTGALTYTGSEISIPKPVCVAFLQQ